MRYENDCGTDYNYDSIENMNKFDLNKSKLFFPRC